MRLLILILFSFMAHAQTPQFQYQLDGTYPATLPGNLATRNIRFTLMWNEKNQVVKGIYQDNFFTSSTPVVGSAGMNGRVFNVKLSRIMQGVSNIAMTANVNNLANGVLPVMVYMRDPSEATVNQANVTSTMTIRADYVEPAESACDIGFGSVSGFCGLYRGSLSEISDSANLCNLPDYGFRVELSADAKTNIYFYYSDSVIGIPTHSLGAFPSAPVSSNVTNTIRHCGVLVGTSFPTESCQSLSMTGDYTEVAGNKNFRGRYTITDETSGNSCAYDINVDREKTY